MIIILNEANEASRLKPHLLYRWLLNTDTESA